MAHLSQRLKLMAGYPKYLVRLVRTKYFRGSGWYAFKPSAAYGPPEPLHLRMWNRHFVVTAPSSKKQDLDQPHFPGREPRWYIADNDIRIALENEDDFRTTFDVYAGRHYDRLNEYATPGSVIWDIGANLGVASLIFAQNPNVNHVYAYEPLPHTFTLTMRSVAANPDLSRKISLENLGIGKDDRELQVRYTVKAKSAIGLATIPSRLKKINNIQPADMTDVTIRLADAADVLRAIRARHPKASILLKLDAEGAEYEIIDRLIEASVIQEINAAAIEWHDSPGEEYLTSRLLASGFQSYAKALEPDGSIGMIDAWR
jgi:FkbM family methyltransferase